MRICVCGEGCVCVCVYICIYVFFSYSFSITFSHFVDLFIYLSIYYFFFSFFASFQYFIVCLIIHSWVIKEHIFHMYLTFHVHSFIICYLHSSYYYYHYFLLLLLLFYLLFLLVIVFIFLYIVFVNSKGIIFSQQKCYWQYSLLPQN